MTMLIDIKQELTRLGHSRGEPSILWDLLSAIGEEKAATSDDVLALLIPSRNRYVLRCASGYVSKYVRDPNEVYRWSVAVLRCAGPDDVSTIGNLFGRLTHEIGSVQRPLRDFRVIAEVLSACFRSQDLLSIWEGCNFLESVLDVSPSEVDRTLFIPALSVVATRQFPDGHADLNERARRLLDRFLGAVV